MYYLYNPKQLTYIGKRKNIFYATRDYSQACLFDNYFTAQNIIDNGNLRKDTPGRDNFEVWQTTEKELNKGKLNKPHCPTEQEINKKALFSFDELEREIKNNERKIKTCKTYLNNVFKSVERMGETLNLVENKIVLIYHYIESGGCKTDEEKVKINELLNRTLLLRRKIKQQRAMYAVMETGSIVNDANTLTSKLIGLKYWEYDSIEDFIRIIEEGQDIIK